MRNNLNRLWIFGVRRWLTRAVTVALLAGVGLAAYPATVYAVLISQSLITISDAPRGETTLRNHFGINSAGTREFIQGGDRVLLFNRFDPTLGNLTSVAISAEVRAESVAGVQPFCGAGSCSASGFAIVSQTLHINVGTTSAVLTSPVSSGGTGCGGPANGSCQASRTLVNLLSDTVLFTDPADLTNFTGYSPFLLNNDAFNSVTGLFGGLSLGTSIVVYDTDFFGAVTVAYTFDEFASPGPRNPGPPVARVPEPSAAPLMAMALAGLWALRRRRSC